MMKLPLLNRLWKVGEQGSAEANLFKRACDTLLEIFVIYMAMLLIFAGAFAYIEGHDFVTSLYWAGITAPTTGYGDISPKTGLGMFLAVLLTHTGVIIIAMFTARLILKTIDDRNAFTHEEQEEMKVEIKQMNKKLDLLLERLDVREPA